MGSGLSRLGWNLGFRVSYVRAPSVAVRTPPFYWRENGGCAHPLSGAHLLSRSHPPPNATQPPTLGFRVATPPTHLTRGACGRGAAGRADKKQHILHPLIRAPAALGKRRVASTELRSQLGWRGPRPPIFATARADLKPLRKQCSFLIGIALFRILVVSTALYL